MLFPCSEKSAIVNQLEQEGLEDKNRNKDKDSPQTEGFT